MWGLNIGSVNFHSYASVLVAELVYYAIPNGVNIHIMQS